ncbi:MAG: C25 family cysteine peptidase, partial [Thermoanaerobaculia bacterium]
GIGQTLFAAPGLIPGIGAASDCAVDPALTLTHSPATVGTGDVVTFVSTVTNLGPFNPTSGTVSVTITIDPGLTFSGGASGTGWSCAAPVGQSVTCTRSDALAAQTSFPPITFNATVIAAGPATLSGNSATVSNAGDVNTANNTATDIVGVKAPTLARFRSFEAVRAGKTVHLNWRTSYESDNLGFRVHREVDGERELLTKSVIAGSALFVRSREMASGRNYSWVDRDAVDGTSVSYWLEDIGLDGVRQWTGPAFPRSDDRASARSSMTEANSPSLGELGDIENPTPALHKVQPGLGIELSATAETLATAELIARPPAWTAPAEPGAKLLVAEDGWYRVTRAELISAGFDPGTNPSTLRMLVDGVEMPIVVRDGSDGIFDPSDSIAFYGIAREYPYDAHHPYWLVGGKIAGQRITTIESPALPSAPSSFSFSIERRDRTVFFSALTNNGDAENFFGDVITPDPVSVDFTVQNLDVAAGGSSPLRIGLQGATEAIPHDVAVRVNGNYTGSIAFFGQQAVIEQFDVPNAWLHEGINQVTLVANGGDDDVSVVDFIQLTYPHLYRLDLGALRMTAPSDSRVAIPGLADESLRVIDVSDPQKPLELRVEFVPVGPQQTAFVNVPGPKARRLLAFTPARVSAPAAIVRNAPSNLRATAAGADLVIIAHPSLLASMQPLRSLRQSQGLVTQLVDATDIYDEFAFGQKTPYSIRSFLQNSRVVWKKKPRFVLLVGDASFDPKQYLGMGDYDLVPTKLIPTTYLKTDSDDWYVDANSDGLPELAIGRLPARTPAEAATMVSKIVAREAALAQNPTWASSALLVAGQNDGFDFETATSSLGTQLSPGMSSQTVFEGTLGSNTRSTIVSMFNAGQLLVNYTGHGSQDVWSKNAIFGGVDAATLTNGSKLPVVVAMTCLNGLFDDLYAESLAETLLKAPNGGAAAVWASSALTDAGPQVLMNHELFRQLFQGPPITLGEAVMKAKAAVSDPDVRRSWILFGDPSMRLK